MTSDQLRQGPTQAEHRLVLLHGWGADADDLLDLGEQLAGPEIALVALRAPERHPLGVGRQWYDLQQPEWPGLPPARDALRQRFLELNDSLPLERTVVLGFSQGAAMGLDVASALPIAGLIACSGYPHPGWAPEAPLTRVLLTHGDQDPVVPPAASVEVLRLLRQAGARADLLRFKGGHSIDASLFPSLQAFLADQWQETPGSP
ncbi:esterase [Synechococcus sp. CS-1325]|uniref:alpha/beta hydrolase n=1 Tax=unclassified Synechococcus TaxID=2626047 RepID=UPI000DB57BD2|nr:MULTISPECIES: esterase [unclassified Synechococcus]PZV01291.1 MAG: esterase [Cyanobium sp.]MCT0200173.1 esterase [Synechococcus sp. CS-1325]MCT0212714.1 esterase [Synechococcus sp. CS-1326]MCT0230253.1 esterase [Synechococcus sp. CS-1324]MCT0233722.1 esterase [Synechococcus sp. CS-1327]